METKRESKRQVIITLPTNLVQELDKRKRLEDRSRSNLILRSVKQYLEQTNIQTT